MDVYFQDGAKGFDFSKPDTMLRLDGAMIVYHGTNLRVRTRSTRSQGLVGYGTCGPGGQGSSVNGLSLRPGMMWAAESGAEIVFVAEPGYESIFAAFSPGELKAHFKGRQREARLSMPRGAEILQRDPAAVRRLFTWGKRLVTTACTPTPSRTGIPLRS